MTELLPCPFCNGSTHLSDTGVQWVVCNDCSTEGPVADTEQDAIAKWNTRAAITASAQQPMHPEAWFKLLSLRSVMQSAFDKGESRHMSVWERDLEAINAAIAALESQAKATEGKAGMAGGESPVRRSTAGTGLRVGAADAVQPATSEIMDVTAGETAPNSEAAGKRPVPSVSGDPHREQQRDTTGVTAGETAPSLSEALDWLINCVECEVNLPRMTTVFQLRLAKAKEALAADWRIQNGLGAISEGMLVSPTPELLRLADDLDAALNDYLLEESCQERVYKGAKLTDLLWNNKAGIIALLRRAASHPSTARGSVE